MSDPLDFSAQSTPRRRSRGGSFGIVASLLAAGGLIVVGALIYVATGVGSSGHQSAIKKHLIETANDPDSVEIVRWFKPYSAKFVKPCPHCGETWSVPPDKYGSTKPCPKCKKNYTLGTQEVFVQRGLIRGKNALGAKVMTDMVFIVRGSSVRGFATEDFEDDPEFDSLRQDVNYRHEN